MLPAALGYGAVDIVVADIIVVPLVVVQGGEVGMSGGTRVDVDNAVPASPIVDIPNGCIGSVGPIDFGRVGVDVGSINVVDGIESAAGLASLNPVSIIPWLYYPFVLGIAAIGSILFRYPRRYS